MCVGSLNNISEQVRLFGIYYPITAIDTNTDT